MKFDFSKSKDLQNKSQLGKLDLMMKNVLHITYELDSIRSMLTKIDASLVKVLNDQELQHQVDEYFDRKPDQRDLD